MTEWSSEERAAAREIFERTGSRAPCEHCGGVHLRACPRVKRIRSVHDSGGTEREREVEYWPPGTWEEWQIVWPEDAYDDSETQDDAG